jgi:capsular exopolysaccharide synthesis family protein
MDIHEYLGVLRRGVVMILVGILAGLAGGFVAQSMERPTYSATSRELLTNKVPGELSISQGRIASYVLVASSGLVLQQVIDELHLDTSVEELARRVTVVAPPDTVVIEITATAASAEQARDTANTISRVFAEVVADQLETTTGVTPVSAPSPTPGATAAPAPTPSPSTTRLPDGTVVPIAVPTAPVRVVNLEEAALPTEPDPSAGPLMLLVGGVLGLALGLLAASVRESLDRRIRAPRDAARVTDVPVVGGIVSDRRIRRDSLTARAGTRSPSAESFRALRAHVDHLRERDGRRTVVLTAAGRGQGTTTVAANLAIAIANTGTSVVSVDADLRHPDLSSTFGLASSTGLASLLNGRAELADVLHASGIPGLTVVPAGGTSANPGELIAMPRMRSLLAELADRFEMVVIDTPTIASASDAAVLGSLAGTTLLIVAQGATRPRLDEALALLEAGGSEPVGIVLTRTRRTVAGRSPQTHAAMSSTGNLVPEQGGIVPTMERSSTAPVAREPEPAATESPQPVSTTSAREVAGSALVIRAAEPAHLADPLPKPDAPRASATEPKGARGTVVETARSADPAPRPRQPRRASQPAVSLPAPSPALVPPRQGRDASAESAPATPETKAEPVATPKPNATPKPAATKPMVEPDAASGAPSVTEVEHTLGSARSLDSAFAALPIATAAERRAESGEPETDAPKLIERPIVVKPDPVRPSRFAPDPAKAPPSPTGAYASAPAPRPGTAGKLPPTPVTGTVVNTVSIRVKRDQVETPAAPPPIRHILPRPTASTIPPHEVEAARSAAEPEPEPELVEVRPRTGPVPVPRHEPLSEVEDHTRPHPVHAESPEVDDDPTAETPPALDDAAQTRAIPIAGSLLGEIGGLPRIEVRTPRPAPITDTAPNPERIARETYELRARELERVAHERLMREQQRLAVSIREQLAHDKRELESVLDNRLEDTVLRPRS